jgi:hypothetical protein
VVVPPAIRAPRIVHSPIPEDDIPMEESQGQAVSEAAMYEHGTSGAADEKPRRRNRGRSSRKKEDTSLPKGSSVSPQRQLSAITASVPATSEIDAFQPMEQPSEDEPRFCVCNDVSAGTVGAASSSCNRMLTCVFQMIACDAKNCKYQWVWLSTNTASSALTGSCLVPSRLFRNHSGP